jgi:hypothetical protein
MCHLVEYNILFFFSFVTDEESFEDADGEEGEYHLGGGDSSILIHSKYIVLVMYTVRG